MKKQIVMSLVSVASLFVVGCGGGGGTTPSRDNPIPTKVVSTPIQPPAASSFTRQASWELSKVGAPTYALSTEGNVTDFSTIVYPNHPRLYFRDTDMTYLQSKLGGSDWRTLKAVVTASSRLPKTKSVADAIAFLDMAEAGDAEYAKQLAMLALMERDPYYINLTIEWAKHLSALPAEGSDGDILLRRRIERLSEIYDWLHADLNATDRATIRAGLKKFVDKLMSFDYMLNSNLSTRNYIQKHSRWGDGVVAQALLAMYGDFDASFTKAYADDLLSKTREHLRNYQDVESYIAADGGWHLGWGYAYFNANYMLNDFIWSTATNETLLNDWMGGLSYWYLYGLRADKSLPQMGDATISPMGYGVLANLYQSKFKNDGYAKWYLNTNKELSTYSYNNLFDRFIMQDETAKEPNLDLLPTSRYFKQVGTVIARDTWDFDNATLFIFKSSPFYNAGHHHRDENSFTIDYKTSLALDTGFYDQTDSNHYKNYYVRTIAHNAITVYNPSQVMQYITDYNTHDSAQEKALINDGGQIYRNPDSLVKADIVEGGKNRLDGVVKYQYNDNYTYVMGDATKTYDPSTVSLAKREVMYVQDAGYNHPVILVLDKIQATNGNFQKRYLLHSEPDSTPVVVGNKMTVVASGSKASAKMVNLTLYPTDATLKTVGGTGHEYELMNGSNPTPIVAQIVNDIKADKDVKSGTWRLEVSPPLGKQYDIMLNAIFVDDASVDINAAATELIEDTNAIGAQLPNRVVVFSKDKANAAIPVEYKVAKDSNIQHTVVTGYSAGESVKVSVNGEVTSGFIVGEGGCVDFKINVTTQDVIKVTK